MRLSSPEWDGHLLLLYDEEPQRRAGVTGWVCRGLELGAKILYTEPDDASPDRSLPEVLRGQPDALAAMERGQIEVVPADATAYDPTFIAATIDQALDEGYPTVRWSGEASTAWGVMPRSQHAQVEQATEQLCATRPLSVMCQYSTSEATAAVGLLAQAHGAGLREQQLRVAPVADGVGLAGELDASNQEVLRSLLAASTPDPGTEPFVVDLAGVDFVDLPGVRALLLGTVGYRGSGGQVRLRAPQPHVAQLLRMLGVEHEPGLVLEGRR